jgi:hypothetical protein
VRFEALATVAVNTTFQDVRSCSLVQVYHVRTNMLPLKCQQTSTVTKSSIFQKLVFLYVFFIIIGVGLTSPGTAATSGLLYSPR